MKKYIISTMIAVVIFMLTVILLQQMKLKALNNELQKLNEDLDILNEEYDKLLWNFHQINPHLSEDCERGYDCKETMVKP